MEISDTIERKFVDTIDIDDYEVLTDTGFKDVVSINKTVPYVVWEIITETHSLKCADTHIVFLAKDCSEIFAKDLKINDEILTDNGPEKVLSVKSLEFEDNMYDIELGDSSDHRYYTNGILSHNTTSYTVFCLWYATLFSEKRIIICANKLATAIEIMDRIRMAYEYLPKWLKPSVTIYNKSEIIFANKSSIKAFATSSSAARGTSGNCVTGDTPVTIVDDYENVFHCSIDKVDLVNSNFSKKYYYSYKTINDITNVEYTGFHSTDDLDDSYLGSGKLLINAIEQYGIEHFHKTILNISENRESFEKDCQLQTNRLSINETSMKVLTENGFKNFEGVRKTKTSKIYNLTFTSGITLKCTDDHLIKDESGEFVKAKNLQIGTKTSTGYKLEKIDIIECEETDVYDLVNVEDGSHYLTNGITSHNCIIIDEMAFIPKNVIDEFFASVIPIISSSKNSKAIAVSTANGAQGLYYELWQQAIAGESSNDWKPFRIDWWEVPGRDNAWKEQQILAIGQERWNQEFANEFTSSSFKKLIPDDIIEKHKLKLTEFKKNGLAAGKIMQIVSLDETKIYTFKMWHEFQSGHCYLLAADIAEGVGLDTSVIYIWDVTNTGNIIQCAKFAANNVSVSELAFICQRMAKLYANPYIAVERNGIGVGFIDVLRNVYNYDNIVIETPTGEYGIRSHVQVKAKACLWMREMLTTDNLDWTIYDGDLLDEMVTFVKKSSKMHMVYAAINKAHDDHICTLLWTTYVLNPDIVEKYFICVETVRNTLGVEYPKILQPIGEYTNEDINNVVTDELYQKFLEYKSDISNKLAVSYANEKKSNDVFFDNSKQPANTIAYTISHPVINQTAKKFGFNAPFAILNDTEDDFDGPSW